jgi:regulator of sigma E protease
MDQVLIKVIQFFLSLSLLIVLHELGHFIPARLFGTRVEKFFLFFDIKFALFKKKIGETVYGIGWLPLGGYVKISGMIDESMDKEQMQQPPKSWEFRSKPAWQRLIIMLGGVTVNLILGVMIYIMIMFVWGKNILTQADVPNGLESSPVVEALGFRDGDIIRAFDGIPLENLNDASKILLVRSPETVRVLHADGTEESIAIPEDFGQQLFKSGERPFSVFVLAEIESVEPGSPDLKSCCPKSSGIAMLSSVPSAWRTRTVSGDRTNKIFDASLRFSRGMPSNARMMSPSLNPSASTTGLDSRPLGTSAWVNIFFPHTNMIIIYIITPKIRFTVTPPNMMISRCQAGLERNSQDFGGCCICSLSILSSIIPEILTYPPSGSQPIP